jgi:quercetin dioxygenase-like cupin family protein
MIICGALFNRRNVMSFGNQGIVLGPGEGKPVSVLGDPYTYKVVGGDTGGNYSLIECTTAGDGPPPHIHKAEEEAFYVLEGEVNVTIGDQTISGTAGSFVLIPRGIVHTFSTVGTEPAKMLVIISPAGFEQFFTEIDGVTDVEKIMTLAPRYNLAIMGPPGS